MFLPVSKIKDFAYNRENQTLTISFGYPTSSVVRFTDIPLEVFKELKSSDNYQEFYMTKIRGGVLDGHYGYKTIL